MIENARIYTVNPKQPLVQTLAVRGGRIVYTGSDPSSYIGQGTQRLDLHGATVVPGLIDSHGHMAGMGDLLQSLDFRGVRSIGAVVDAVSTAAAKRPNGEWIRGRAWDQTEWGGQFPTAESLDRAAPDNPVFLTRVDGHAAWVNHRALALAGIDKSRADPPGGRIVRDVSGTPTGILVDAAQGLVRSKIPKRTDAEIEQAIALAAQECVRFGLTGVHDAGVGTADSRRTVA